MIVKSVKRLGLLAVATVSLLLAGCATQTVEYPVNSPEYRSVLIVAVVNCSTQVNADKLLGSVMRQPIAERGYYPFPPETVRMVFESEGLYEPERAQAMEPTEVAKLFDSDLVMYVSVDYFDTRYMALFSRTEVQVSYRIFNREGQELTSGRDMVFYDSNSVDASPVGLLVNLVQAAVARGVNNTRPLAHLTAARITGAKFAPGPVWGNLNDLSKDGAKATPAK